MGAAIDCFCIRYMCIKGLMLCQLPHIRPGQTVGLLGGSFDPPHEGHVQISKAALRVFGLDRLFWLVSPGNPLKDTAPASQARRMAAARAIMRHPRVHVSDVEARLGTRYTAETVRHLVRQHQGVRFVWLMGADNLTHFHRWKDWRDILQTVPVGVLARPGDRISARFSPAARSYRRYQLKASEGHLLALRKAPVWCFMNVPMVDVSSSQIRAQGGWLAR